MSIVITPDELEKLLKNDDRIFLSFYILEEHTRFSLIDYFFMHITFTYDKVKRIQKHISELKEEYKEVKRSWYQNKTIAISRNLYDIMKGDSSIICIEGDSICFYKNL